MIKLSVKDGVAADGLSGDGTIDFEANGFIDEAQGFEVFVVKKSV